ncbi:hypothetical protein ACKI14_02320 [Streptomyces turgidiscabies]|uniref:hypothetical protein n=1 Tax=Streptomyces turgidiscabies TaxID=85558 RepID=UPI0038F6D782
MSTTIANLAYAAGLLAAAAVIVAVFRWLSRHDRAAGSRHDQFIRATHERARTAAALDPLALADPAAPVVQAEAHLLQVLLDDPDVADGFARLDRARRDNHTNQGD